MTDAENGPWQRTSNTMASPPASGKASSASGAGSPADSKSKARGAGRGQESHSGLAKTHQTHWSGLEAQMTPPTLYWPIQDAAGDF